MGHVRRISRLGQGGLDVLPDMGRGRPHEGAADVLSVGAAAPAIEHALIRAQGEHAGLEVALRMRHPTILSGPEVIAKVVREKRDPASFGALPADLLVGIADVLEARFPTLLGIAREGLGFARDGEDLTARFADCIDDAVFLVATQLVATGRSPEAAVEDEYDEGVLLQHPLEPAASNARRRIEEWRGRSDCGSWVRNMGHVEAAIGLSGLDREPFAQSHLLAILSATENQLEVSRSGRAIGLEGFVGIDDPGQLEFAVLFASKPGAGGLGFCDHAIGNRLYDLRHACSSGLYGQYRNYDILSATMSRPSWAGREGRARARRRHSGDLAPVS